MSSKLNHKNSFSEILGIDIGGTGIKAALVNIETGALLSETVKILTPYPASTKAITAVINQIVKVFQWNGPIGMGFPAIVKNGVILSAANISKDWIGYNALANFKAIFHHPIHIMNDADAAALAEMRFGAGRPYNKYRGGTVLMITLGTGIGSALVVDGNLVPNTELGHIEIGGIDAEKLSASSVKEREGLSWEEWGGRVNVFLRSISYLISPDVIIIGGGVSENCQKFFTYLDVDARIVSAVLGNDAGIIGAALGVVEYSTKIETK